MKTLLTSTILALLALIGAAQNPARSKEPAAAPKNTLPVARTLTSTDGRTLDVTILSKSEKVIKAKRADGKEFEITLDKLSDADKAFVASTVNKPIKMLIYGNGPGPDLELVKKHGIAVEEDQINDLVERIAKEYDIIWYNPGHDQMDEERAGNFDPKKRRFKVLENLTGVVIFQSDNGETRKSVLHVHLDFKRDAEPFVNTDGNFVIYNDSKREAHKDPIRHPEIYDKVIEAALKAIKR